MKIIITDDDQRMEIDNDDLDNRNFVDITIYGGKLSEVDAGTFETMTVPIDDLWAALLSFQRLRTLSHKRDKLYESK